VECRAGGGLHINSPRALVEILRPDGQPAAPGEPGTVVITDLTNFASPIIRYAGLGDVARWSASPCACGRCFPRLEVLEGRSSDTFVLPDGRRLHPFTLTQPLAAFPAIRRFQIVQDAPDAVRLLIVPDGAGLDDVRGDVLAVYRTILGDRVRIEITAVDAIPTPPGRQWPPTVRVLTPLGAGGA
jgi:phenylacetate-CoA ligase